jgi:hypothetical protein
MRRAALCLALAAALCAAAPRRAAAGCSGVCPIEPLGAPLQPLAAPAQAFRTGLLEVLQVEYAGGARPRCTRGVPARALFEAPQLVTVQALGRPRAAPAPDNSTAARATCLPPPRGACPAAEVLGGRLTVLVAGDAGAPAPENLLPRDYAALTRLECCPLLSPGGRELEVGARYRVVRVEGLAGAGAACAARALEGATLRLRVGHDFAAGAAEWRAWLR